MTRPTVSLVEARAHIASKGVHADGQPVIVIGVRRPSLNVFDDPIIVVVGDEVTAFNGNTDPSKHAPNMATLCAGAWRFERVVHNRSKPSPPHERYPAFGQRGDVVVHRDETDDVPAGKVDERGTCLGDSKWRGQFGIHLHHGGEYTTTSEGCQTIIRDQWAEAYALIDGALTAAGVDSFLYILVDGDE